MSYSDLEVLLGKLERTNAWESRLVAEHASVWVAFFAGSNIDGLRMEVVPSVSLPDEYKPSPARAEVLRQQGFEKADGASRPWVRTLEEANPAELAATTKSIFEEVFGVAETPTLVGGMVENQPPKNPSLVDAMRELARQRDDKHRHAMYEGMLNATFLVPIDPRGDPDADIDELLYLEQEGGGRVVLPVFSDWRHLRWWEPRGWDFIPLHGSDLFPAAAAREVASVRINPKGRVGGELYAHEVDTLVTAIRRHRAKRRN